MNEHARHLQLLMKSGQEIGRVPRGHSSEFIEVFRERFPDRIYSILGNDEIVLIVHPPLSSGELSEWRRLRHQKLKVDKSS